MYNYVESEVICMSDLSFKDFLRHYESNAELEKVRNILKKQDYQNNNSIETSCIISFEVFISILENYHKWLFDNFEIKQKDN